MSKTSKLRTLQVRYFEEKMQYNVKVWFWVLTLVSCDGMKASDDHKDICRASSQL